VPELECLGRDAIQHLGMLLQFHALCKELSAGRSLRKACKTFKDQFNKGLGSVELPLSARAGCVVGKWAARYFGRLWRLDGPAKLFIWAGPGTPFTGLTENGERAWRLTRAFLQNPRIMDEND